MPTRNPVRTTDYHLQTALPYLLPGIFIECPQPECVCTGRKVHIVHAPHRIGMFPFFIMPLQHILIPDSVRSRKIDGRERNGE